MGREEWKKDSNTTGEMVGGSAGARSFDPTRKIYGGGAGREGGRGEQNKRGRGWGPVFRMGESAGGGRGCVLAKVPREEKTLSISRRA